MKYTKHLFIFGLFLTFSLFLSACGPEPDTDKHQQVRQRLQTNMDSYFEPFRANIEMLRNSALTGSYFGQETTAPLPASDERGAATRHSELSLGEMQDESSKSYFENSRIQSQIFIDEHLESQEGDTLTYRFGEDFLCAGAEVQGSSSSLESDSIRQGLEDSESNAQAESSSQNCASIVDAIEPRVEITLIGSDEVTIRILVSSEKHELLKLESSPGRLAISTALGELKEAVTSINEALPEDQQEQLGLPQQLSGRIEFAIERLGANKGSVALNVPEAVEIVADDFEYSLGKSEPLIEIVGDASQKQISVTSEAGASELKLASWFETIGSFATDPDSISSSAEGSETSNTDESSNSSSFDVAEGESLTGLLSTEASSIDITFDAESDKITISEIAQRTTFQLDGKKVLDYVIKGSSSDTFEAVFKATSGDKEGIEAIFDPGFEISAPFNSTKLKSSSPRAPNGFWTKF